MNGMNERVWMGFKFVYMFFTIAGAAKRIMCVENHNISIECKSVKYSMSLLNRECDKK